MDVRGAIPTHVGRVGSGDDRLEVVLARGVGEILAPVFEVRVEGRRVRIAAVVVASTGRRLPDLDIRALYRLAVLVRDLSADIDHLPLGPATTTRHACQVILGREVL